MDKWLFLFRHQACGLWFCKWHVGTLHTLPHLTLPSQWSVGKRPLGLEWLSCSDRSLGLGPSRLLGYGMSYFRIVKCSSSLALNWLTLVADTTEAGRQFQSFTTLMLKMFLDILFYLNILLDLNPQLLFSQKMGWMLGPKFAYCCNNKQLLDYGSYIYSMIKPVDFVDLGCFVRHNINTRNEKY